MALYTLHTTMPQVVQKRLRALVKPSEQRTHIGNGGPNAVVSEGGPSGDFVAVDAAEVPVPGVESSCEEVAQHGGRQMLDGVEVLVLVGRVVGGREEVTV